MDTYSQNGVPIIYSSRAELTGSNPKAEKTYQALIWPRSLNVSPSEPIDLIKDMIYLFKILKGFIHFFIDLFTL